LAQKITTTRPESKAAAAAILMGTVLLISTLMVSNTAVPAISTSNSLQNTLAQTLPQTVIHRDLIIDLGNGIRTNAQLTMPAVGNGSFPGVLLVAGSGPIDMDSTLSPNAKPFLQIAQYLSERGFAVLRYDKRGVGANSQIIDQNVWDNATFNDLKNDAITALNVLATQPEVDPNKITLIGHSEGTMIVPRVVLDLSNNTDNNNNNTSSTGNLTRVANVVLMGVVAQNLVHDIIHWQLVNRSVAFASQALEDITSIDINSQIVESQLRPLLEEFYQNVTSPDRCTQTCPWFMSHAELEPTLDIIGNMPNNTSILLMNGENDSQTAVEQAFLVEQKLNEANHPDHTLITYPGLGHAFYPSPLTDTIFGPVEQYVLSDLHRWLTDRTYGSQ
jgi:alpha-beta hydrolase superfamily lysophospholipase